MPTFKAVPEYFDIPGQGLGVSQGESMSKGPAPGQGLAQVLQQALANPSHKLLVLCRHGQGHHNVCESTFGTEKWESQVALQPTFGSIVLEDAHLTDLGMQQVRDAGTNLLAPLVQTLGWPERMYCSPMRRCIETFMESWGAVVESSASSSASPEAEDEQSTGELPQELPQELPHDIVKTWIMGQGSGPSPDPDQLASQYPGQGYSIVAHVSETFRETLGRHYCDKRVSHSETISQYGTRTLVLPAPKSSPTLHVSWQYPNPPMDEEDTMWSPTHRETDDEIDARIGPGLNEILSGPERYISLTCHSGVIHSALRVLGHPPLRQLLTGGVVFVVVTPEPCAGVT